jgi:lipoic acid synthetase
MKLPSWFKQEIPEPEALNFAEALSDLDLHTVCQEAKCPNLGYCFKRRKVTFMILGDTCTRNCSFCAVGKPDNKKRLTLDLDEPLRIAEAVKRLGLNYVVITSVTRDDLEDQGAGFFAKGIELIHAINQQIKVEVLIPDFQGRIACLKAVLDSGPDLVAHNLETVRRLCRELRPQADYRLSLDILNRIKELKPALPTKSSLMLGLGETEREVVTAMEDLRESLCDILTLGQYLAPSPSHYPIKEFIDIEQFQKYEQIGLALGFRMVLSGPLVRSSYQAEETFRESLYA